MKKIIFTIFLFINLFALPAYAASDPFGEAARKYILDHPELNSVTGTATYNQVNLLQYQCVLTVYSITGIDSLQTVSPVFTSENGSPGYFDASLYNKPFDSLLVSMDSVLITTTANESSGSGTDSILIIRLGAFSPSQSGITALFQMDTIATAKTSMCQRWLPCHGTKVSNIFPYWGFLGKGIACTDVNAKIYIFNIIQNVRKK